MLLIKTKAATVVVDLAEAEAVVVDLAEAEAAMVAVAMVAVAMVAVAMVVEAINTATLIQTRSVDVGAADLKVIKRVMNNAQTTPAILRNRLIL